MNGTIAQLTFTNLLRGWRGLLLGLLPLALIMLSLLIRALTGVNDQSIEGLLDGLNLTTVVPLVALIIGTGALSTEIDDGSIIYLLTKPIKRGAIIGTKLAVAAGTALAFTAIPTLLSGIILSGALGEIALAYTLSAMISCVVYCAIFLMLSVLTRHAVLVGLIYILLWEGLVVGLIEGTRVLSVQHWGQAITAQVAPEVMTSSVNWVAGTVLAVVIAVAATWFAGSRLRSLALTGDS